MQVPVYQELRIKNSIRIIHLRKLPDRTFSSCLKFTKFFLFENNKLKFLANATDLIPQFETLSRGARDFVIQITWEKVNGRAALQPSVKLIKARRRVRRRRRGRSVADCHVAAARDAHAERPLQDPDPQCVRRGFTPDASCVGPTHKSMRALLGCKVYAAPTAHDREAFRVFTQAGRRQKFLSARQIMTLNG